MGSNQPATTTTQSQSQPWSPATPLLQNLLNTYGGINTSVSPDQQAALSSLSSGAGATPNFGNTGAGAVNSIFSNASTTPELGMVNTAYSTLQNNLNPTASGANLNPYSTPGFGDALNTMTQDISNSVKGQFAGSGRDPSGAGSFAQSLGRGLTQGEAPVIAAQANTNMQNMLGANSTLYGAGANTATTGAGLNTSANNNYLSALSGAGMIPGLYTAPGQSQLAAANTAEQLPFANLAPLLTAGTGIAGLGGQNSGTTQQTPANNPLLNYLGGGALAAGLMFSDERLKTNIRDVGILFDGTPVKEYNYIGDDTPQLGMLAQDIERHNPDSGAVVDIAGYKAVNYRKATARAAAMGHHVGMLEAA